MEKTHEISERTSLEESRIYRTLSIFQSERKKLKGVHAGILNMKGRGLACQEIWDRVCDIGQIRKFKRTCDGFASPSITISDNTVVITLSKEIEKPVLKEPVRAEKSYCQVSGKRIYSVAGARRSLRHSLEVGNGYRPLRMYSCEYCGKHHLTSNIP